MSGLKSDYAAPSRIVCRVNSTRFHGMVKSLYWTGERCFAFDCLNGSESVSILVEIKGVREYAEMHPFVDQPYLLEVYFGCFAW